MGSTPKDGKNITYTKGREGTIKRKGLAKW